MVPRSTGKEKRERQDREEKKYSKIIKGVSMSMLPLGTTGGNSTGSF